MHSCEHNNGVKRRKSRKDIENTKKIWRLSGWKCIQNSMHGLWANLKRRGSCFCVIQGRKLSSFRSSAKAAGAKISVYTKILHFQQKSQWGTSWENTRVHLFSITSFHRINRMNEETKTTFFRWEINIAIPFSWVTWHWEKLIHPYISHPAYIPNSKDECRIKQEKLPLLPTAMLT